MTDFPTPSPAEQPDPFPAALHDLLDGRLDADAADALRARLAAEPALAEAWEELRRIQAWVRAHGPEGAAREAPPALRIGLDAKLAALQAGGATAHELQRSAPSDSPEPERDPQPMTGGRARPGRLLRTLTLAYAAAALLVVGFSLVYITSLDPGQGGDPRGEPTSVEQADLDVKDAAPAERDGLAAAARDAEDGAAAGSAARNRAPDESKAESARAGFRDADTATGETTPVSKPTEAAKRAEAERRSASGEQVKRVGNARKKTGEGAAAKPQGGGRESGPYGAPGGATPIKLREPSDEPAPKAGSAPKPTAVGGAPEAPATRPAAPPATEPRGRRAPTLAETPDAPAPSPADPSAGAAEPAWGSKSGPLARAGRQLANGDTVYVLETDDPGKARAALLALLDQAADDAAPRRARKKARGLPAESPPAPARQPRMGGAGGARAKDATRADRFYRVDGPALVDLGKRVDKAAVDALVVHSAMSRERTAALAALLERHAAEGAGSAQASAVGIGGGGSAPSDRGAVPKTDARGGGGRKQPPPSGSASEKKTDASRPAASSDAKAPGASGAAAKPAGRVRILIIQRRTP